MGIECSQQGAVDVVSVAERIDVHQINALKAVFDSFLERGRPQVVLDMQEVALIDGAGLELLLDIQERYQTKGGSLQLAAANGLCKEIFKITGLGSRFDMYSDTGAAVRSFIL